MIYTTKIKIDINTIKNEMEEKAKKIGFGVLHMYDFKQILHTKGFPNKEKNYSF